MCVKRIFFTKNCAFIYIDSGSNGKGMEWDPNDSCWNLRIPIPNLISAFTSLFALEFEPHDIIKKRISSVELTLLEHKGKGMIKCFILIITVFKFVFLLYQNIYSNRALCCNRQSFEVFSRQGIWLRLVYNGSAKKHCE